MTNERRPGVVEGEVLSPRMGDNPRHDMVLNPPGHSGMMNVMAALRTRASRRGWERIDRLVTAQTDAHRALLQLWEVQEELARQRERISNVSIELIKERARDEVRAERLEGEVRLRKAEADQKDALARLDAQKEEQELAALRRQIERVELENKLAKLKGEDAPPPPPERDELELRELVQAAIKLREAIAVSGGDISDELQRQLRDVEMAIDEFTAKEQG